MSVNVHITHIEDTWANILANADHGQSALNTNATADLAHTYWLHLDATKGYIYANAASKRYNVGTSTWEYLDSAFDDLDVLGTTTGLRLAQYLHHYNDVDTGMEFTDTQDQIVWSAGGVPMITMTEDTTQDIIEQNSGLGDVDFVHHGYAIRGAVYSRASDGYMGVCTTVPYAQLHVREDDTGVGSAYTSNLVARFERKDNCEIGLFHLNAADGQSGLYAREITSGYWGRWVFGADGAPGWKGYVHGSYVFGMVDKFASGDKQAQLANGIPLRAGGSAGLRLEDDAGYGVLVADGGDFYSDNWQSFTPTVSGWAATPTTEFYYKRIGDLVFVQYKVTGTGNADNTRFSLPKEPEIDCLVCRGAAGSVAADDATMMTYIGVSLQVAYFSNAGAAGAQVWGDGATKWVCGQFWYQAA